VSELVLSSPSSAALRPFALAGALASLVVAQVCLDARLASLDAAWVEPPAEATAKASPELTRALSFGQLPVAIDWLWMKSLQDPAYSHVRPGTHPPAFYELDLASDLDPAYRDIYTAGATMLAVVRTDGPGARDLLLKAERFRKEKLDSYSPEFRARFWPDEWRIPLILAYTYLFELGDMPKAADAFLEASTLPGAPSYLGRLATRLRAPGGRYEVGLRLLDHMMSEHRAASVREELARKHRSLEVGAFLYKAEDDFSRYRAGHPAADAGKAWERFLAGRAPLDPWGGELRLDARSGRILTTTPHEAVFGLD
jgi:hypothetical protein